MTLRTRSDINVAYFDTWPFSPRFEQRGPDECWPWLRAVGNHGYGITYDGVASRLAHRVAWTLHHQRQIPEGDTVDHVCHVRTCVNPAHLRLLSNVDNATDNGQRSKTNCPKGHVYDEANTIIDGKGYRKCRACGVEPLAWLRHVLTELPQCPENVAIDDLLPFNFLKAAAA